MTDQRTMAELLRAPTEGYADAIMVPPILAEHFELKHSLINMMTSDQFFGLEKDNPHDHICWFNKITSTVKYKDAWDCYKDLLRACPHHGFTELHQLDTFYNALNYADQDSLNSGNLLERRTQDVLTIIENKSKCLRTRSSSSNLVGESSPNPTSLNLKRRNRRRSKQLFILKESHVDTMADQRTMAELLRAPTEGYAKAIVGQPIVGLKKNPPRFILTWEDLVSKFINEFFPPSKTNIRNEIFTFQQRFDESFHEARDRYKDLLHASPHHGFTELYQLVTFYNALNPADQDSLNSAAGGNLLEIRTQDVTTSFPPNHLLEEFADELALNTFPSGNDDLPFDIESDLREIEYLLNHDPTKEMDSILKDLVDEDNHAEPNNDLFDSIPKMFTDEHTLDYSSPPLYDDFNDDLVEFESDNDDVYDDPFESKKDKIKESKLLIDELDPPRLSDFLPYPEYDSFLFEDFSEVDALPSTDNKDKIFNLGILIQENLSEVIVQVTPDKNVKKISVSHTSLILEDFNPLLSNHELPFHKEVLGSELYSRFHLKMRKSFQTRDSHF
nr:reverse transcriptase domain-containing protein [Tanacetum cinerariifolium]